jgi:exonuclease-1
MGIKGLFQFLKRYEIEMHVKDAVIDRTVGVDLFWFIHQSKGDFFVLQDYLTPLLQYASRIHGVVDGAPPSHTKQARKEKREKREKAQEKLTEYNELQYEQIKPMKEELRRQAWYPTKEYVAYVKTWLEKEGAVIHQAPMEADTMLIDLEKSGRIDCIVSNDSDLLLLGARHVFRMYSPTEMGEYRLEVLCRALQLTPRQWHDFMMMCRCMNKSDVLMAYSYIRIYKDLDYALEKYTLLHENKSEILLEYDGSGSGSKCI